MAIEQATRSDAALQSKLAALKTERIRVETGKNIVCILYLLEYILLYCMI